MHDVKAVHVCGAVPAQAFEMYVPAGHALQAWHCVSAVGVQPATNSSCPGVQVRQLVHTVSTKPSAGSTRHAEDWNVVPATQVEHARHCVSVVLVPGLTTMDPAGHVECARHCVLVVAEHACWAKKPDGHCEQARHRPSLA